MHPRVGAPLKMRRLQEGLVLVFEVTDPESARDSDGNIDASRVTAIRIVEIVNYHGS